MRKHSLNHINSQQNLKVYLYQQLNKKCHYFPDQKLPKRDNTRPKKQQPRREPHSGSWLYDSNKQNQRNKSNLQEVTSKKGIKTTKKNSCSYIASNTSLQESENNKIFQTFSFANLKSAHKMMFKLPIAITDCDLKEKEEKSDDYEQIYSKIETVLGRYRTELIQKEKKIKELKKENKVLKERFTKIHIKKI